MSESNKTVWHQWILTFAKEQVITLGLSIFLFVCFFYQISENLQQILIK